MTLRLVFAGSYLGIFWAFVNPIVTILVYWFLFEKGRTAGDLLFFRNGMPGTWTCIYQLCTGCLSEAVRRFYLQYFGVSLNMADKDTYNRIITDDRYKDMGVSPTKNSVKIIDGVMVVNE